MEDSPVIGLTQSLNAAQPQQQQQQDNVRAASQNMAEAARSLGAVQGSVSTQTMSIQQMTMASSSQSKILNSAISQLSAQINTLASSLAQHQNQQPMPMMPQPMVPPEYNPPPLPDFEPPPAFASNNPHFDLAGSMRNFAGSVGGYVSRATGFARRGGSTYLGAAHKYGGMFGGLSNNLASLAVTPTFYRPQDGSMMPHANATFLQNASMAIIGQDPRALRHTTMMAAKESSKDAMTNRVADLATGLIGGGGELALDMAGLGLSSKMTKAMGLTGVPAFAADMLLSPGTIVTAPLKAGLRETMRQASVIRGFGDQYSRNSFRFGVGNGVTRRGSFSAGQTFGRGMNKMAIQDLTYDDSDLREIFAGASQSDLMRGVNSTGKALRRMKDIKIAIKTMGHNIGLTVQEGTGMMGELQSLGVDPTGLRARAAIFGASGITGLTHREGLNKMVGFAGQYAAMGTGAQALGVARSSLQAGQYAMNSGSLNATDVAVLGGRQGADTAIGSALMSFIGSGLGKAALARGDQGEGKAFDYSSVMGLKGIEAPNTNVNADMAMRLGSGASERAFLRNSNKAMRVMLSATRDLADRIKSQHPDITDKHAMDLAVQNVTRTNPRSAPALRKLMDNYEASAIEGNRLENQARAASLSSRFGRKSIFKRVGREMKSWFTGPAEVVSAGAVGAGLAVANSFSDIGNAVAGYRETSVRAPLEIGALADVMSKGKMGKNPYGEAVRHLVSGGNASVGERAIQHQHDEDVKDILASGANGDYAEKLLSYNRAFKLSTGKGLAELRGSKGADIIAAFGKNFGVDVVSDLNTGLVKFDAVSDDEKKLVDKRRRLLRDQMAGGDREIAKKLTDPKVLEWVKSYAKDRGGIKSERTMRLRNELIKDGKEDVVKYVESHRDSRFRLQKAVRRGNDIVMEDQDTAGLRLNATGPGAFLKNVFELGSSITAVENRESQQNRAVASAGGIADILKDEGVNDSFLRGDVGFTHMAKLFKLDLSHLKTRQGKDLYKKISALKSITGDIDTDAEKKAYTSFLGHQASTKEIEDFNSADEDKRKKAALLSMYDQKDKFAGVDKIGYTGGNGSEYQILSNLAKTTQIMLERAETLRKKDQEAK